MKETVDKKLIAVATMAFLCGVLLTTMIVHPEFATSLLGINAKPKDNVEWIFECHEGTRTYEAHNLITDRGETLTRDWASQGLDANITMLATGNITGLDKTDTVLTNVFNDAGTGIPQYPNSTTSGFTTTEGDGEDPNVTLSYKWTFSETVNLNASAVYFFNTTYAYAMANFPGGSQTFTSGENLTCTWTITYDGNT